MQTKKPNNQSLCYPKLIKLFTTSIPFYDSGLKVLMTQTWVMKHNCSNSGPCSSLTDHCSREWPNSGKILVGIFCIFDMSPVSDWMIWLVMCRFPGRRSQDWLPWNGNSRTAEPDVSFNLMSDDSSSQSPFGYLFKTWSLRIIKTHRQDLLGFFLQS